VYWTPGVSKLEDAAIIERLRLTRADLNDLIGLPGYNEDAIRAALQDYGDGHREWQDDTDSERADYESREEPNRNTSGIIDALEYHGPIQGKHLLTQGFDEETIPDPDLDYFCQVWLVGQHVIKVQLSPSPRKRHPYFISSFEKVPGTILGNALPDILNDIEEVCNASLRSLVNNLSIASGPQVIINDDRMSPSEISDDLYPWKRWHVNNDPMNNNSVPISFYQPDSNASELLGVYEKFTQIADDISAIPRYVTGNENLGGAGRTASGLAMLMNNASKILQTVAANIDRDIIGPMLDQLYDMVMLTDRSGMLRGDEDIRVLGVNVAVQKETDRVRQLEMLQTTANPLDMQIMGVPGRAKLLREIADTLGLDGQSLIPSDEELKQKEQQNQQMQQMQMAAQAQGDQAQKPGGPEGNPAAMMPTGKMQG
jgi:hypothetical protein